MIILVSKSEVYYLTAEQRVKLFQRLQPLILDVCCTLHVLLATQLSEISVSCLTTLHKLCTWLCQVKLVINR